MSTVSSTGFASLNQPLKLPQLTNLVDDASFAPAAGLPFNVLCTDTAFLNIPENTPETTAQTYRSHANNALRLLAEAFKDVADIDFQALVDAIGNPIGKDGQPLTISMLDLGSMGTQQLTVYTDERGRINVHLDILARLTTAACPHAIELKEKILTSYQAKAAAHFGMQGVITTSTIKDQYEEFVGLAVQDPEEQQKLLIELDGIRQSNATPDVILGKVKTFFDKIGGMWFQVLFQEAVKDARSSGNANPDKNAIAEDIGTQIDSMRMTMDFLPGWPTDVAVDKMSQIVQHALPFKGKLAMLPETGLRIIEPYAQHSTTYLTKAHSNQWMHGLGTFDHIREVYDWYTPLASAGKA